MILQPAASPRISKAPARLRFRSLRVRPVWLGVFFAAAQQASRDRQADAGGNQFCLIEPANPLSRAMQGDRDEKIAFESLLFKTSLQHIA